MVFCGKPSKACALCRNRRIKCDLKVPACSQCIRVDKECPGYRDHLDLLFRDENERTIRKARPSKSSASSSNSEQRNSRRASSIASTITSATSVSIPTQIFSLGSPSTNEANQKTTEINFPFQVDEGLKFFFRNYVTIFNKEAAPLWPSYFTQKKNLDAISSVGLAGLSNATKDASLMVVAKRKHSDAIKLVIKEIEDVSHADLNLLFKKVLMLIIFELINGTPGQMHSLAVHVDGASSVLRRIALKNLQEKTPTQKWQLHFFLEMYIKYFQMELPPSPEILQLRQHLSHNRATKDEAASSAAEIMVRAMDLHSSVRKGELTDPSQIVLTVLLMEAEIEEWEKGLPSEWEFKIVEVEAPNDRHFTGRYHEYSDVWNARMINHYRWVRILLNELLLTHMAKLPYLTTSHLAQKRKSLAAISTMATDICCSTTSTFQRDTTQIGDEHLPPHLSGIFAAIWPLSIAGSGIGVSQYLYDWTINRLEKIVNNMGVSMARTFLERTNIYRERWIREGIVTKYTACDDIRDLYATSHASEWDMLEESLD